MRLEGCEDPRVSIPPPLPQCRREGGTQAPLRDFSPGLSLGLRAIRKAPEPKKESSPGEEVMAKSSISRIHSQVRRKKNSS